MRVAKPLLDFYINSSIHVALAVVSLALITGLYLEISIDPVLLLYIFSGTVSGYNFVKFAEVAGLHHRSLTKKLKIIQIFSFLSFVTLVISAFFVEVEVLLWSSFFGAFTLLYALPVFSKRRNLRSISGIKVFIIGFVWAGVTVVLPATGFEKAIFETLAFEFFQRFLLVLVWILPFEIRDLKYDLEQLGTIPQRVGVTKTKILGLIFLVVVVFLEFIKPGANKTTTLALVVMCMVTAIAVWKTKEKQSRYFTAFWIEGIPILWLLLLLFFWSL